MDGRTTSTPLVRRGVRHVPLNTTGLSFDLAEPQDLIIGDPALGDPSPLAFEGRLRKNAPALSTLPLEGENDDDAGLAAPPPGGLRPPDPPHSSRSGSLDVVIHSRPSSPSSLTSRWRSIREHVRHSRPSSQDSSPADVAGARGKLALLRVLGVQRQQQSVKAAVLAAGAAVPKSRTRRTLRQSPTPSSATGDEGVGCTASAPATRSDSGGPEDLVSSVGTGPSAHPTPQDGPLSQSSSVAHHPTPSPPKNPVGGSVLPTLTPAPPSAPASPLRAVAFVNKSSRSPSRSPRSGPGGSDDGSGDNDDDDIMGGSESLGGFSLGMAGKKQKSKRLRWFKRWRSISRIFKKTLIVCFIGFLFFCCADASIKSMSRHEVTILFQAIALWFGLMVPVWLTLLIFLYKGKLYRECAGFLSIRSRRREHQVSSSSAHQKRYKLANSRPPLLPSTTLQGDGGGFQSRLESLTSGGLEEQPPEGPQGNVRRVLSRPIIPPYRGYRGSDVGSPPLSGRPTGLSGGVADLQWFNPSSNKRPPIISSSLGIKRFVTMPNISARGIPLDFEDRAPTEGMLNQQNELGISIPSGATEKAPPPPFATFNRAMSVAPQLLPADQQHQQVGGAPYLKTSRVASDADLIFFNWTTQKQQMRHRHTARLLSNNDLILKDLPLLSAKPQLPPYSRQQARDGQPFDVPTAATTGHLLTEIGSPLPGAGGGRQMMQEERAPGLQQTPPPAVSRLGGRRFQHHEGGRVLWKRHQRRRRLTAGVPGNGQQLATDEHRLTLSTCFKSACQKAYALMLLPTRLSVFLHDFPAFQISLILRNLAWCAIYIWATTLVGRASIHEAWDTQHMPTAFWNWENCFMWMITWDYIVLFLASQDRWRYTLSFESLIDLLTMPPAKVIVSWFGGNELSQQYTIYSGSLRFLRLVRVESTLTQVVPWISQVKLKIISLVVASSVITLMFACTMFTLEAPYSDREGFNNVYGFVFFAVVTISTVGYGDFAPKKQISRAIVMVAIIAALAMLPNQIQKLITALQTPPRIIGRIPTEHHGYIVFAGPIDPKQLALICRELACALPGSCSHILVITPDTVQKYTSVIRYAFTRGGMRVTALQGDFTPLHTRPLYRRARAVLIVGNTRSAVDPMKSLSDQYCGSEVEERGDQDALQLDDDHQTILRFLGAQHICWPDRPTCVQLTDGTAKLLVTEMGAYHVVCLQHIKMKLIAKSCAGCPGFITIVTNLFHQPSLEVQSDALLAASSSPSNKGIDKQQYYSTTYLYARGCGYQIYRLEFPECFYGISYALLVRILLTEYQVYLLGLCCVSKEFWLNPVGFHIGDELDRFTDWPFAGIVASPSLRVVQEISRLKDLVVSKEAKAAADAVLRRLRRSKAVIMKKHEDFVARTRHRDISRVNTQARFEMRREAQQQQLSPIEASPRIAGDGSQGAHTTASAAVLPVSMFGGRGLSPPAGDAEDRGSGVLDPVRNTPYGIKEVADVDAAIHYVFKRSHSPLLLVCGWPRGIVVFLAALQASCRSNVVILAPGCPAGVSNDALLAFKDTCAWVRGSAADVADLLRAGALEANSCAVFSTTQVPWKKNLKKHRTDTQAILVREFIYAIHNSDALLEKRLNHLVRSKFRRVQWRAEDLLHAEVKAPTAGGGVVKASAAPAAAASAAAPLVVLELQNESNIDYLSVTSLPSAVSWTAKMEVDDLWVQEGLSIMNSEFAAGKVLLTEMLHGMIAYTLPVSRYCMDTRIIDHLVEGSHLPLPDGVSPRCPFWLEPIPDHLSRGTFGELFVAMLHERAKLAIGIYRTVRKSANPTPLDLLQGPESTQYVVISCPPLDMPLMRDDNVYVILPCPIEALGLLFNPGESVPTPAPAPAPPP